MKILVAVKSYQEMWKRGAHDRIRETWGRFCLADLRFFFGGPMPQTTAPDEIWLPVEDHYQTLSEKANAIFRWAVDQGYEYVVLVDTDTFINPVELAKLPWGYFDYAGEILPFGSSGSFAFGGCGLAVSHDAMNIVLNNKTTHNMDDINIGNILLHRPQPDVRVLPRVWDRRVGWHFPKNVYSANKYDPQFPWMDLMAQAHLGFPKRRHIIAVWIGGAQREVVIELSRVDREAV